MTLFADDLLPGRQFALGSHQLTEAEILEFARQWDPLMIHTDPSAAQQTPLGGVIASGLHTLAVYQRLAVRAFWSEFTGGIGKGFEIHFRRPVRPDTTLTGVLTVQTVSPRPDRGDAAVAVTAELTDDNGDVVLALTNHSIIPLRAGSPASS